MGDSTLSARHAYLLIRLLAKAGLDENEACLHLNYKAYRDIAIDERIPLKKFIHDCDQACYLMDNPAFCLEAGLAVGAIDVGLLGQIFLHSQTIGQGTNLSMKYQALYNNGFVSHIEQGVNSLDVVLKIKDVDPNVCSALVELRTAICLRMAELAVHKPVKDIFHAVHFQHAPRTTVAVYQKLLGIECLFGQTETRIIARQDVLTLPVVSSDDDMLSLFLNKAKAEEMALRKSYGDYRSIVERYLDSFYGEALPSLRQFSQFLEMSESSVKRRLNEEGVNYQRICADRKNDWSKQLLEKGHSISQVASLLGYSQPDSFIRFFKKENGETPTEYRRQIRW